MDDIRTHEGAIIYRIAEDFEVLVDKAENSLKFCMLNSLVKQLR